MLILWNLKIFPQTIQSNNLQFHDHYRNPLKATPSERGKKQQPPFQQRAHTHPLTRPIIYFETGAKVEAFRGASYIPENGTSPKLIFQEGKRKGKNHSLQDRYIWGSKKRIPSNFPSSPPRERRR